jgi:hypothetical protein
MRDGYMQSDPRFIAWQAGEKPDLTADGSHREWSALVSDVVARGVRVRRARIVSEPVSNYVRFEYYMTASNESAGEEVRWLPRRQASDLLLPGNDLWLFDNETALFLHFDGNGELPPDDEEEVTDPEIVGACAASFELVWQRAIPHADYRLM